MKDIRHPFDAYVKRSLRHTATDYYRNKHKQLATITPLDDCSCSMCYKDTYFLALYRFYVFGYEVIVENFELAEALLGLSKDVRIIIIAYYFLDMSDAGIGFLMHKPQRTVNYLRHKGLRLLREVLSYD